MNNCAIIVAAGKSERFGGDLPKQFLPVADRPLLSWTIAAFEKADKVEKIVVVTSEEYLTYLTQNVIDPFKFIKVSKIVSGGVNRKESVMNGLNALPQNTNIVAIHDGVRALISSEDIDNVIEMAELNRAAIVAVPSSDTVKEVDDNSISNTLDRNRIWLAQTPQAFEFKLILEAHKNAQKSDCVTDDSLLVEKMGIKVKVVKPTTSNIKVTTPEDLAYVESVLRGRGDV